MVKTGIIQPQLSASNISMVSISFRTSSPSLGQTKSQIRKTSHWSAGTGARGKDPRPRQRENGCVAPTSRSAHVGRLPCAGRMHRARRGLCPGVGAESGHVAIAAVPLGPTHRQARTPGRTAGRTYPVGSVSWYIYIYIWYILIIGIRLVVVWLSLSFSFSWCLWLVIN